MYHPNGKDENDRPYRSKAIPPTGTPVELESSTFVGRMLLLHDTGNEPEPIKVEPPQLRKGLVLRVQGKFKKPMTVGELHCMLCLRMCK